MKHTFLLFLTILILCNSLSLSAQPAEKVKSIDLNTQSDSSFYSFGVLIAAKYFPKSYYPNFNSTKLLEGIQAGREKVSDDLMKEANSYVRKYNADINNSLITFRTEQTDSASYYFGMLTGNRFFPKHFYLEFKDKFFQAGLDDQRVGKALISEAEAAEVVKKYNNAQLAVKNEKSIKEGEDFLAVNAKKEGVIITASGLQYEIIEEGKTNIYPIASDTVTVNYKGTFINGEVFDENDAISFPLNQVIKGWTEGIQLMSLGSKFKFYIPSNLGYGTRGNSGIPPYSTLIFEVELTGVSGK